MNTFFETMDDYIYGYTETSDYEFLSDEELERIEMEIWGNV